MTQPATKSEVNYIDKPIEPTIVHRVFDNMGNNFVLPDQYPSCPEGYEYGDDNGPAKAQAFFAFSKCWPKHGSD
jgi:hypothetical protein